MNEAARDPLYHDPLLVRFYDIDNGWADDTAFCARLAEDARCVLDLGCGTGVLLAGLDAGKRKVGVDPAAAMLDVARHRPGGDSVEWIAGDARSLDLDERFDLIVMTGHAFQVFLSRAERAAVLATIARHLRQGGRFIFDTRNPVDADWRSWTPRETRRHLDVPGLGAVEAWNDVRHDTASGIVTYETHYRICATGEVFSAPASDLAFPDFNELSELMAPAGLTVRAWYGDWQGHPWHDDAPEIIAFGGLA